jgi:hypothetical protein
MPPFLPFFFFFFFADLCCCTRTEHEENVRIDFFGTLSVLFKQTRTAASLMAMDAGPDDQSPVLAQLHALVPSAVKMLAKQLKVAKRSSQSQLILFFCLEVFLFDRQRERN